MIYCRRENKGSALYAYCMCSDGVVAPIKEYFLNMISQ